MVHDKTHKGYHSQTTKNTCQDGLPAVPYQPPPPVFPSLNYELATSSLAFLSFLQTVNVLTLTATERAISDKIHPHPHSCGLRGERKERKAEQKNTLESVHIRNTSQESSVAVPSVTKLHLNSAHVWPRPRVSWKPTLSLSSMFSHSTQTRQLRDMVLLHGQ